MHFKAAWIQGPRALARMSAAKRAPVPKGFVKIKQSPGSPWWRWVLELGLGLELVLELELGLFWVGIGLAIWDLGIG